MTSPAELKISAELTPNPDALKFVVNQTLLKSGSIHYADKVKAEESALASRLFKLGKVTEVLIGTNFITINKAPKASWEDLAPSIRTLLEAVLATGEPVAPAQAVPAEAAADLEGDEAIAQKICQILDREIRPAVAQDGGDIIFYGYKDGVVTLHLQGACSSCPSSIMTLKMGVENRLKQEIPEIKYVDQI